MNKRKLSLLKNNWSVTDFKRDLRAMKIKEKQWELRVQQQ